MGGGEETCPGGGYCHISFHISLVLPPIFITKIRSVLLLFTIYTIFLLDGYFEGHGIRFSEVLGVFLAVHAHIVIMPDYITI